MEEQIVNKEVWVNGELQSTEQITLRFKSEAEKISQKEAELSALQADLAELKGEE